jgi:hypothetical protein
VEAAGGGTISRITAIVGDGVPGATRRADASPLGGVSVVPWLTFPVIAGAWVVTLHELTSNRRAAGAARPVRIDTDDRAGSARVHWPDGADTTTYLAFLTSRAPDPGAGR